MHGRGACVVGCVHDMGACMVAAYMAGGVHGKGGHACPGGHAWGVCGMHTPQQILKDMVNEWAAHILLECILVL